MRPRPVRVGRNAAFREIAETFLQHRYNHVYVVNDDERFLGAVALHDIKAYLDHPELAQLVIAQEIQHEDFPWVTADTPLEQALARFQAASSERLPVLDDDEHRRLIGTLSKNDLLMHLMDQVHAE